MNRSFTFLSVHLPCICPQSLDYPLRSASNPRLIRSAKSLHHASLFEQTAFISVMDRWTPRESCLLLSHLANSFHGRSEKENRTWHIYLERGGVHPFDQSECQHHESPHAPLHYTCVHTHARVEVSQGRAVPARSPCKEAGCSLWGGCRVLIAICGGAPLAISEYGQKVCAERCTRS